jgi:hypothetical protein
MCHRLPAWCTDGAGALLTDPRCHNAWPCGSGEGVDWGSRFGGQAPTAERTVGPARMIAESLTSKPGIREHNRHSTAVPAVTKYCPLLKVDRPCHRDAGTCQSGPTSDIGRPRNGQQAVKLFRYLLTDPRQFDILPSGPGWRGLNAIRSLEMAPTCRRRPAADP